MLARSGRISRWRRAAPPACRSPPGAFVQRLAADSSRRCDSSFCDNLAVRPILHRIASAAHVPLPSARVAASGRAPSSARASVHSRACAVCHGIRSGLWRWGEQGSEAAARLSVTPEAERPEWSSGPNGACASAVEIGGGVGSAFRVQCQAAAQIGDGARQRMVEHPGGQHEIQRIAGALNWPDTSRADEMAGHHHPGIADFPPDLRWQCPWRLSACPADGSFTEGSRQVRPVFRAASPPASRLPPNAGPPARGKLRGQRRAPARPGGALSRRPSGVLRSASTVEVPAAKAAPERCRCRDGRSA